MQKLIVVLRKVRIEEVLACWLATETVAKFA